MEQETEFPLLGRLIHDIRTQKGIGMDELCRGLCDKGTLSRIENGKMEPNLLLAECLFTRLGKEAPARLLPLTAEQYRRYKIRQDIETIVDSRNKRRMELLREYKNGPKINKFEEQFCLMHEGWYISQFEERLEESLSLYEQALNLTMAEFSVKDKGEPSGLFSRLELGLINNVAHSEYYIYDSDKSKESYRDRAIKRMRFLKSYYETHVEDCEHNTGYSVVLFNLTNWTGLLGNHEEALALAEKGLRIEEKSIWYHVAHLFNKGYCLASLGQKEAAEVLLRKALAGMKFEGEGDDIPWLVESLNKSFGCTFSADSF